MALQAVIVDFHGTLSTRLFWDDCPDPSLRAAGERLFSRQPDLVQAWMRGRIGAEAVMARAAPDLPPGAMLAALETGLLSWRLPQGLTARLQALRSAGVRVALASDMMAPLHAWLLRQPEAGLFDRIWLSCREGRLKNDGAGAWAGLCADLGASPEEAVLLDDSVDAAASFTALGGRAIRVSGPDDTLARLAELVPP